MRSPKLLLFLMLALPLYAREFDVRPAPAWVEHVDVDTSVRVARQNVRWGIYDLLHDHQVRAGQGGESQYFRTVRSVLTPSAVQNASELELDFDPSFERLTLHDIFIIRNGKRVEAMDVDDVRVIEKEDDADDRIYDGERTALIFLNDVRPGDVIDYSWSIDGDNPLLDGRYTGEYDLSVSVPTKLVRHRLLWPTGHPLQWRGGEPAITMIGGEQVFVWERRDIRALDVEDQIPSWYEPWDTVQVSEFASWSEVAQWADAMFRLDERSTAAVKQLAARISSENASRDARITAAIRFVQDEVRYLGIEMGRNSHEPHQPWETLEQRWGDCKDKTLLLVALLRELGLEAYPALVNTRLQHRLEEKLPSPFLFDHVIAQVVDRGKVYWVDGTVGDQGGTLATLETPLEERALVVRAGTRALTPVITNMKGATLVEQAYTTHAFKAPVELEVKTTYSGSDADAMRSELATLSIEDYAHDRINDLAADQPKIESAGLPHVSDDRLRNVIVVTEKYRLPDLWKDGHWTWYPRVLEGHLSRPDTMIRTMPLAFDYPLDVTQIVRFNFDEEVDVDKSTSVTETPTFRYQYSVDKNGKTVYIKQTLRARRDAVDVKDIPDHLTKLNAIWSEIGYRLAPDGAQPRVASASVNDVSDGAKWAFGLGAVAIFVTAAWRLATRRRKPPAIAFRPGEAPASALAVGHADEIDAHLSTMPCVCGGHFALSADIQRARYDERDLTIVTRSCVSCGREQSVYFTAA